MKKVTLGDVIEREIGCNIDLESLSMSYVTAGHEIAKRCWDVWIQPRFRYRDPDPSRPISLVKNRPSTETTNRDTDLIVSIQTSRFISYLLASSRRKACTEEAQVP